MKISESQTEIFGRMERASLTKTTGAPNANESELVHFGPIRNLGLTAKLFICINEKATN